MYNIQRLCFLTWNTDMCIVLALEDLSHFLNYRLYSPEPRLCNQISHLAVKFSPVSAQSLNSQNFVFFNNDVFMSFLIILISASCHYQYMIFPTFLLLSVYVLKNDLIDTRLSFVKYVLGFFPIWRFVYYIIFSYKSLTFKKYSKLLILF